MVEADKTRREMTGTFRLKSGSAVQPLNCPF